MQSIKVKHNLELPWVVGFIEGEGTFSGAMHTKTHWQPYFGVCQQDEDIIMRIKTFFEEHDIFGGVNENPKTKVWYFTVQYKAGCILVYELIRPHMHVDKKIIQIESWAEKLGVVNAIN